MSTDTTPATETKFRIYTEPDNVAYKDEDVQLFAVGLDPTTVLPLPEVTTQPDPGFHWVVINGPADFDLAEINGDLAGNTSARTTLPTKELISGVYEIEVAVRRDPAIMTADDPRATTKITVERSLARQVNERIIQDGLPVETKTTEPTPDQGLWVKLRQCVSGRTFSRYDAFLKQVLCDRTTDNTNPNRPNGKGKLLHIKDEDCYYRHGVHGYELIEAATEVWLLCHACCGDFPANAIDENGFDAGRESIRLGYEATADQMNEQLKQYLESSVKPSTLPYLDRIIRNLNLDDHKDERFPFCPDTIRSHPCMFELIWSYWQEEGMLVQTLNAIARRFQNRRVTRNGRDALANFEVNPLRPLNNLLWGYIQESRDFLSVQRRAYEYEHQYGLTLIGKAAGPTKPAERRSKFLEAFHNLLHRCSFFYRENSNKFIEPDAFPLLGAIRAVHLLLAEGAHNQWGDLTTTARKEMMIQQWLLAQPPMREFLHSRAMVPYDEPWMGQVDSMKKLMDWTDVTIIHFHKLAVFGEIILLSIRFGDWNDTQTLAEQARNWAIYFKPEIQGYIEDYRAATGVDLSADVQKMNRVDATSPAVHLQKRARLQNKT